MSGPVVVGLAHLQPGAYEAIERRALAILGEAVVLTPEEAWRARLARRQWHAAWPQVAITLNGVVQANTGPVTWEVALEEAFDGAPRSNRRARRAQAAQERKNTRAKKRA